MPIHTDQGKRPKLGERVFVAPTGRLGPGTPARFVRPPSDAERDPIRDIAERCVGVEDHDPAERGAGI